MTAKTAFALALTSAFAITCSPADDGDAGTAEIIDNLLAAGVAPDAIQLDHEQVFLGGDAEVTLAASRELLTGLVDTSDTADLSKPHPTHERWLHPNRVSTSINRICINGTAFTGAFGTALNSAIAQFNSIGLRLTIARTTGSTSGCQAIITARTTSGFGRSSGFPSGGLPYPSITLGTGFLNYDAGSIRHQILHLLGHTLGIAHADAENPDISCGPGTGAIGGGGDHAPPTGVGYIMIPGFPVATVGGSVMNTCYRATEPGLYTSSDRSLLSAVY